MTLAAIMLGPEAGRSPAEIAALGHLRAMHDALVDEPRLQSRSDGRPSSATTVLRTVRSLHQEQRPQRRACVASWLTLEALAQELETDLTTLQHEIASCANRSEGRRRLASEISELDAKWQVLQGVLGSPTFDTYVGDVFAELARFRQRFALYGARWPLFQDDMRLKCIGNHEIRNFMTHEEALNCINSALQQLDGSDPEEVLLLSHYPLLMQHCGDAAHAETLVVSELLVLLARMSPPRERLTRLCFEQIADSRRGDGVVPPPDEVRPHRLVALAKASYAHSLCSQDELDRILTWLGGANQWHNASDTESTTIITAPLTATISMDAFLAFHLIVSDVFHEEDAAYVTYLMRMWGLHISQPRLRDRVTTVISNYETRGQQHTAKERKREVCSKLEQATQVLLPPRLEQQRQSVAELREVTVTSGSILTLTTTHTSLVVRALSGLRVLRLVGLALTEFPVIATAFAQLQVLDVSDNRLCHMLPSALASLSALTTLRLDRNALTNACFPVMEDDAWAGLQALHTLNLSHNQLTSVPTVVGGLQALERLILSSNRLRGSVVLRGVLEMWQQRFTVTHCRLHTLDLSENQLTALPDELFLLAQRSLVRLYLHNNALHDLPTAFSSLQFLEELTLSHNQLRHLTTTTRRWTAYSTLHALQADHNQLEAFPGIDPQAALAAGSPHLLASVYTIRLHHNRLRVLPSLAHLRFTACHELELSHNALTELAELVFQSFPVLRVCKLQHNALRRLPDSIVQCTRLAVLEVYENQLEYVPAQLAKLQALTVLNLRGNQLVSIPTDWHAFLSTEDRPRVLHTLHLQRNPIRNKVLRALVDGSSSGDRHHGGQSTERPPATAFRAKETRICELYFTKLIDTLRGSQPVAMMKQLVVASSRGSHSHSREEAPAPHVWKGKARFVLQFLDQRLIEMTADGDGGSGDTRSRRGQLEVPTDRFRAMLLSLPVASTQRELQLVCEHCQCQGDAIYVDGRKFLESMERVGLFNALLPNESEYTSPDREEVGPRRNKSVRKPMDAVTTILQYLQVAHRQRQRRPEPVSASATTDKLVDGTDLLCRSSGTRATARPQSASQATTSNRRGPGKAVTLARTMETARGSTWMERQRRNSTAAPTSLRNPENDQRRRDQTVSERQRQRIAVLEQQLMDQQLLRLTQLSGGVPTKTSVKTEATPNNQDMTQRVAVLVSRLRGGGTATIPLLHTDTIAELKRAIQQRWQLAPEVQVLVARRAHDGEQVRLRSDASVLEYVALATRQWRVSLLVGEQLHVSWSGAQPQQTAGRP